MTLHDESLPPDREIRLALVLNGGVSLAVWMGGVAHEIDDLRRSSWQFSGDTLPTYSAVHEVYTGILRALRTGLRVDVIAGSSAGGINGAALGAAIGSGHPLRVAGGQPLRDLWVSVGDFTRLLRPVTEAKPASLLRGDDYMLPQMQAAFRAILGTGPAVPALPGPLPVGAAGADVRVAIAEERAQASTIRLFITSTAFRGNERDFEDSLNTPFNIVENRLRFRIIRDRWLGRDDFTRPDVSLADTMGLAARASASFPVAFEPTLLEKTKLPGDMIVLDQDTYAMDGGVLDNEPFDPVLDQIGQMPADEGVTRYLVYIVPYSNDSHVPRGPAVDPNLREVLTNVASLPRDEGIDRDFDRIVNLRGLAQIREDTTQRLLTVAESALEPLAEQLVAQQQQYRAAARDMEINRRQDSPATRLGPNGGPESVYQAFPLLADWASTVPDTAPTLATLEAAPAWVFGFAAAERLARRAQAVLRRRLVTGGGSSPAILGARAVVGYSVTRIRNLSIGYAEEVREGDLDTTAATALYDAAYAEPLRVLVEAIVGQLDAVTPPGDAPMEGWYKRLIRVEIVTQSLPSSLARGVAPFEFIRLSSDCHNALGVKRDTPAAKLAGLQIGHFGGFLKKSWRVNDWIWGRLDGVWHLVRLLLDESRLSEATAANPALPAELAAIAFPEGPADVRGELLRLWNPVAPPPDVAAAQAEFTVAFTEDEAGRERCVRAIIARGQLGILAEEVPILAREADADRKEGWRKDTIAPTYSGSIAPIAAGEALVQFRSWDGADEKVAQETSTRAFANLAGQAAVVGSSLLASTQGIPGALRVPFVWLRGVALGTYLFVRSWFAKPLAGLTVAVLLAAAAIVTVLISSTLTVITIPIAIGVVVAASALVLGHGPRAWRGFWTGVAVGAALVSCLLLYHHTGAAYPIGMWPALGGAGAIGLGVGFLAEAVIPRWRLMVFLIGLIVAGGALACLRSSGPLLHWIAGAVSDHWPLGLLALGVALPLTFGMAALAAALSPAPSQPP